MNQTLFTNNEKLFWQVKAGLLRRQYGDFVFKLKSKPTYKLINLKTKELDTYSANISYICRVDQQDILSNFYVKRDNNKIKHNIMASIATLRGGSPAKESIIWLGHS